MDFLQHTRINYKNRPEELELFRQGDRALLELAVATVVFQHQVGRYFLFENPPNSELWREPALRRVWDLQVAQQVEGPTTCVGHGGAYGSPFLKPFRWLSNSATLL